MVVPSIQFFRNTAELHNSPCWILDWVTVAVCTAALRCIQGREHTGVLARHGNGRKQRKAEKGAKVSKKFQSLEARIVVSSILHTAAVVYWFSRENERGREKEKKQRATRTKSKESVRSGTRAPEPSTALSLLLTASCCCGELAYAGRVSGVI